MHHEARQGQAHDRRPEGAAVWWLAGLTVLAIALRFWRLGTWNFEATEIFTHRDSITLRLTNPRPLSYLLNYYLVGPLMPLDEYGLRLLPAIFGVLAVLASYYVTRRLAGARAALFAALLVTVSPLLVYYSQFARYWSLVFLLCTIYPYAIYIGLQERHRGWLIWGLITAVLAALAHPVSVLLIGGPALWLAAAYLRPSRLRTLWAHRGARWGLLAAALIPGSGQFLLRAPMAAGVKQVLYVVAYVESLTLPLVLVALLGLTLLWQSGNRVLATFLVSLAAFPMLFLSLISLRTPVSTYYLLPTEPVFFIAAGIFFDRLCDVQWTLRPRWLLPVTVAAVTIVSGLPTLVSQYRNGRRYDFRGVAHALGPRLAPDDVIYSDQPMVLAHYLPGRTVQKLRYDTLPLQKAVGLHREGQGGEVWVVAPAPSHALRTNLRQGGVRSWIYENCQLRVTTGQGRLDFRQQYLNAFQCPPAPFEQRVPAADGPPPQ
jgi:hypothetical protein